MQTATTEYPRRNLMLGGALTVMVLSTVVAEFWKAPPMAVLHAAILVTGGVLCLPTTDGFTRWFALFLTVTTAALMVAFRPPWSTVMDGIAVGGLAFIFNLMVEVLGAAIRSGGYNRVLTALLARHARSPVSVRVVSSGGAAVLGLAGMAMGSVPTIYYALARDGGRSGLSLAVSASRGFAAALIMNPISPLVIISFTASDVSMIQYLLVAIPVTLLMLALDWLPHPGDSRGRGEPTPSATAVPRWRPGMTAALLVAVAVFLSLFRWLAALQVSALMQAAIPLLVAALVLGLSDPPAWRQALRTVPTERFVLHAEAAPLFVMGGTMGKLIVATGLLTPLTDLVAQAQQPLLEMPFLILVITAFRWIGVSPTVSLLIIGPVFAPVVSLGAPLYTLALVFGGAAAFLVSPLSATTLFVAGVTGVSPFEICLRRQGVYVLVIAVLVSLYAALLLR